MPSLLDMTPMRPLPTSTVFVALTFGAVWIAWFVIQIAKLVGKQRRGAAMHHALAKSAEEAEEGLLDGSTDDEEAAQSAPLAPKPPSAVVAVNNPHAKVIIAPVERTLPSIEAMLSDWAQLGVILLYCWLNEYMPLFAAGKKKPSLDHFGFVTLIFLACAFSTFTATKDDGLLNRLQTEEWKGWMQFVFLAYHYYHQIETYNAVRVFISCYVWMTGFGNFSFFYLKRDFSGVRMWQMLWRLNFAVFWLCLLMGNSYILYYINPLHTFYFLIVFVTMWIGSSLNHRLWPMRFKMAILGACIFLVWEYDSVFVAIFGLVLPTTPTIGAKHGALHEWHFRTTLDHWDTYFGMLFALNFPAMVKWLNGIEDRAVTSRAKELAVKAIISTVCIAATLVWGVTIFPMKKLAYNHHHPYFFMIPLLSYIWLRNVSKWARGRNMELLVKMGKVTLETYLLQHHAWLSSNAKTVVVLIPGSPQINSLVVSVIYIALAQRLFRITIALRARHIPNEAGAAMKYAIALFGTLAAVAGVAYCLSASNHRTGQQIAIAAAGLGLAAAAVAGHLVSTALNDIDALRSPMRSRTVAVGTVLAALAASGALIALLGPDTVTIPDVWPTGLMSLKALPASASHLGDPKLALWVVVAAGITILFGDNLLGLTRLAGCVCRTHYPSASESYDKLNQSIMTKSTAKRFIC